MKVTRLIILTKEYDKILVSYSCNVCDSVLNKQQNKKICQCQNKGKFVNDTPVIEKKCIHIESCKPLAVFKVKVDVFEQEFKKISDGLIKFKKT